MKYSTITIGREFASGGRIVGQQLAEALGYAFYDKEMISLTAQKSGFSEAVIQENEGKKTGSILYGMYMHSQAMQQSLPVSDQIYIAQSQIIRQLSEEGPCVIVGRCADYTLREQPGCLRVYIHAPMEERVRRAKEDYGIDAPNPESHIRKEDKQRAAYYSHFTQNKWGYAKNFHLCIDSSIGLDRVVSLLVHTARGDD